MVTKRRVYPLCRSGLINICSKSFPYCNFTANVLQTTRFQGVKDSIGQHSERQRKTPQNLAALRESRGRSGGTRTHGLLVPNQTFYYL